MRLNELPNDLLAAIFAHIDLGFVLKRVCRALRDAGPKGSRVPLATVASSLSTLKWAYRMGCTYAWDEEMCAAIAKGGDLKALKWARKKKIPWDERVGVELAARNDIAALAWTQLDLVMVRVSGVKWEKVPLSRRVARSAAAHNALDTLQWMYRRVPTNVIDVGVFDKAARNGHLRILKWGLHEDILRSVRPQNYLLNAAIGEHVELMHWLVERGFQFRDRTMNGVITQSVSLELLKTMHALGCPMITTALTRAAACNRRDILEWLRSVGCAWHKGATEGAAKNGHLDLLIWLYESGCPLCNDSLEAAAGHGHLEVVKWIFNHGFPVCNDKGACAETIFFAASRTFENRHVLTWLWNQEYRAPFIAAQYPTHTYNITGR